MTDNKTISSKPNFILRILAGLYLFYLALSMIISWNDNTKYNIIIGLAITVFSIAGIILIINSVKGLIHLHYTKKTIK